MNEYDYLFKLIIIGDSGVGKSSVLSQYVDQTFINSHISTIGVDFKITNVNIGDKIAKLQIWDTAGQERFRTITTNYYRGAHGIILVYDVTNRESFDNIVNWMDNIERYSKNPRLILIGNKTDLPNKRVVSYEEALDYSNSLGLSFLETSAKNNLNIEDIFTKLVHDIYDNNIKNKILEGMEKSVLIDNTESNNYCC
jgi:Ras-related protein Rab-1A